jgi:hypothetical protein
MVRPPKKNFPLLFWCCCWIRDPRSGMDEYPQHWNRIGTWPRTPIKGEARPATDDSRREGDELHELMLVVLQAHLQRVPADHQGGV